MSKSTILNLRKVSNAEKLTKSRWRQIKKEYANLPHNEKNAYRANLARLNYNVLTGQS